MPAVIFDGVALARQHASTLKERLEQRGPDEPVLKMVSVLFKEDEGSRLYTRLKKGAALAAGMEFDEYIFSLVEYDSEAILDRLYLLKEDASIHGIILQKPTFAAWKSFYAGPLTFDAWWEELASVVPLDKDVDCLSPTRLREIEQGRWSILPATVKAILLALEVATNKQLLHQHGAALPLRGMQATVVGCSDIVGRPVAAVLAHLDADVALWCDVINYEKLAAANIVIGALGVPNCITGAMIREGAIVIDVGAPQGDVEFSTAVQRAAFITPVPGGIGPLTVVSLLENVVELAGHPMLKRQVSG